MAINLSEQTTLVNLITPTTLTTTAANVYGTAVDVTNFIGQPAFIFASSGSAGTGSTLVAAVQSADVASLVDSRAEGSTDIILREDTTVNLTLASSCTLTADATVSKVYLRLKRGGTVAASKYIKLEVQSDSSDDPDDTALITATTIDPTTIATSYDYVAFTFPSLVDLASATDYHFVLSGNYDVHGTNYIAWSATTVASGGTLSYFNAAWAQKTTQTPNLWATGHKWDDDKLWTLGPTAVLSTWSPACIDAEAKSFRGRMEVTSGDGSTSYNAGMHVIAQREQG